VAKSGAEVKTYLDQKSRLIAILIYVGLLLVLSVVITGEWIPSSSGKRLWFLSGIGLWVFALLTAPWFRPPRDSIANSVAAVLLLAFLDFKNVNQFRMELNVFRWIAFGLISFTAVVAAISLLLKDTNPLEKPKAAYLANSCFRLSDTLGKGEIAFTPGALISIIGYYQAAPIQQLWLLFAWVFLVSVRPVELLLSLIMQFWSRQDVSKTGAIVGTIARVDNPNIVRVSLCSEDVWTPGNICVVCLPNGNQVYALPLFTHVQESQVVGTGLCHGKPESQIPKALPGHVYRALTEVNADDIIAELSGQTEKVELVGFVVEDSNIQSIRFEVSPNAKLQQGTLVWCRQGKDTIYYQILDARTVEESFESNPRGKHVATATQLGCLDPEKNCFTKASWLPSMNSPVFATAAPIGCPNINIPKDEFVVGEIPGSNIEVRVGFNDLLEFHSAILGVTGTGKTELAFDIIKKALEMDTKVFCVDFTGEYSARLSEHTPQSLGLTDEQAKELNEKLFAVDTGAYGAKDEKKALQEFVDKIREPIQNTVDKFLRDGGAAVGIFDLPEITNTKATLRATELYLSSIMGWARKHRRARKILIVLEEAHTIIPETAGSGFDYDTQWVVSRISQIALQGRKYGVGLLVISQRTALVSKSILSQCNTYFCFSLVDNTSLDYMANVFTSEHVKSIPNLRFLEALVFGKAIRSERPLLIKMKYDPKKRTESEKLNVTLSKEIETGTSTGVSNNHNVEGTQ